MRFEFGRRAAPAHILLGALVLIVTATSPTAARHLSEKDKLMLVEYANSTAESMGELYGISRVCMPQAQEDFSRVEMLKTTQPWLSADGQEEALLRWKMGYAAGVTVNCARDGEARYGAAGTKLQNSMTGILTLMRGE